MKWHELDLPPALRDLMPWDELPEGSFGEVTADQEDELVDAFYDYRADWQRQVSAEAYRLRIREAAQERVKAERVPPSPPFDIGTLGEILARPADPPHRVEGLIPSDGSTLIVAQRKTGKTTLLLNLARALLTGEELLGRFATRPIAGKVAFLNYEVSGDQVGRWAHEAGLPEDRLVFVNLRGRRNPLPVAEDRARLVEILRAHEVESLIVDPFGRAYSGSSQNDPGEVGAWLADLDRFARGEVGATDLVLAAHAGWDGERSRGSSALEDWADSIITVVRDKDDASSRFLRAEGRDVTVEEDRLEFDPHTRLLSLSGAGSRKAATKVRRVTSLVGFVVDELRNETGLSGYEIEKRWRAKGLSFQKGEANAAGRAGVDQGLLLVETGPRNSLLFRLNPSPPRPPHTSPGGTWDDLPDLPYKGEVVPGRSQGVTSPQETDRYLEVVSR